MTRQALAGSWSSTGLCAFTVAIAVYYNARGDAGVWTNVIIWLPMCFFFVSMALYRQHKAIEELRRQIIHLRQEGSQNSAI